MVFRDPRVDCGGVSGGGDGGRIACPGHDLRRREGLFGFRRFEVDVAGREDAVQRRLQRRDAAAFRNGYGELPGGVVVEDSRSPCAHRALPQDSVDASGA